MKKFRDILMALLLIIVLVIGLTACGSGGSDSDDNAGGTSDGGSDGEITADDISDTMESEDGKYTIAMVTDVGQLKDKSFNQGTWDGVKTYAYENGYSYKYYQPANGSEATDTDRYDAMIAAIDNGAEIIVTPGYLQYTAMYQAATEHPEVSFVFIDGWDVGLDNVAGIYYHEEQSGFMAGYAVVKDGFTKLGFTGGGSGTNPAVNRCGYGFAQGANTAAAEMGVDVEIKYSYLYGETYSASDSLQTMVNGWYAAGTEIVMPYGGAMCNSVFAAAAANNGYTIGGDVDQSGDSDTVITSSLKGLEASVDYALSKYFGGEWADVQGDTWLGIEDDATGLPMEASKFETFSQEDYDALVAAIIDGTYVISYDFDNFISGNETFSNVTVDFIE